MEYLSFISRTNEQAKFNIIPIEAIQYKDKSEEIFVLYEELINLKLNYYFISFESDSFYKDFIIEYTSFLDWKDGIYISKN